MKKTWEALESVGEAFVLIDWSFKVPKSVGDYTEEI